MASSSLVGGLTCSVCLDIFIDPMLLSCSHSFCRACLKRCWRPEQGGRCPLCRRWSSEPRCNLVLKNLCETFSQTSPRKIPAQSKQLCVSHKEHLRLFCLEDQQLACVVCQTSRKHVNHTFCPADEAAHDKRVELKAALKILKEKLEIFEQAKETCDQKIQHIKEQAEHAVKQITKNFETLYQFLKDEEESRVASLRKEERQKCQVVQNRSLDLNRKIKSLSDDISALSKEMRVDDVSFLQNVKATMKRSQCSLRDPQRDSDRLIDLAKHLGNLKFNIWQNMQELVKYTPVILDPNTAHPMVHVNTDLTKLRYRDSCLRLPDNPERFSSSPSVLSSVGFRSGEHCWEVEVGDCTDWFVGVTTAPEQRKGRSAQKGILGISCKKGKCSKSSSTESQALVGTSLRRLRVNLSCERRVVTVQFSDSLTDAVLFKDTCAFTERVYPFFSVTGASAPLRIRSIPCLVAMQNYE